MSESEYHVAPFDDWIEHELYEGCVCLPTPELCFREDYSNYWIYAHHSLDGRELKELDVS